MGSARRSVDEVVILRDDQSFERIAAGVHNAFNRVIANRADKHLQLVTTNRDAGYVSSGAPVRLMRTGWSIDCAKPTDCSC